MTTIHATNEERKLWSLYFLLFFFFQYKRFAFFSNAKHKLAFHLAAIPYVSFRTLTRVYACDIPE